MRDSIRNTFPGQKEAFLSLNEEYLGRVVPLREVILQRRPKRSSFGAVLRLSTSFTHTDVSRPDESGPSTFKGFWCLIFEYCSTFCHEAGDSVSGRFSIK